MKIGITTFGADGGFSGISQYVRNLLREFVTLAPDDRFEILHFEDERAFFVPEAGNVSSLTVSTRFRHPIANVFWHQSVLPVVCRNRKYDVLFLPAGNRRLPLHVSCPTVGTVHDFSSLHVAEKYDPARMFYITKVLPMLIRRLDKVLTVSESSKNDIVAFGKVPAKEVVVTPLAADISRYHVADVPSAARRVSSRYGIRPPYILYISRIEHPGKNHVRLIRAFDQVKSRVTLPHQLVLAGSSRERAAEVHQAARESRFAEDIVFTGFAHDEDLPDLYRAADLFVFPSLYEGFGLPLLEAMACGVPVACSNLSSLPEVCGDAGLLFDPYSTEEVASVLQKVLESHELRQTCIERGLARATEFDWEKTAGQTLQVLHSVARGR